MGVRFELTTNSSSLADDAMCLTHFIVRWVNGQILTYRLPELSLTTISVHTCSLLLLLLSLLLILSLLECLR